MTVYIFSNYATSTLASGIGTGDTSLSLDTGDGALFPSPSDESFHIKVTEGSTTEWMSCTARSSDTLTVTRADSPETFGAGATVEHMIKDDALNNMLQKGDFRTNDGSPDGSLAADYTGEEVLDSTNTIWYKHVTGTTWKAMHS